LVHQLIWENVSDEIATTECSSEPQWRPLELWSPIVNAPHNEPAIYETPFAIQSTAQCNRTRSLSRTYSAFIGPTRLDESIRSAGGQVFGQLIGYWVTLNQPELQTCADSTTYWQVWIKSLMAGIAIWRPDQGIPVYVSRMEAVADAVHAGIEAGGFDACDGNPGGNLISRALASSFTGFDRILHADKYVLYPLPEWLEVPPALPPGP
jgi:hypothetical protein